MERNRRSGQNGAVTLSAIVAAILLATAWLGGEMTFRHHIGSVPRASAESHEAMAASGRSAATVPGAASPYTAAGSPAGERRSGLDDRSGHVLT